MLVMGVEHGEYVAVTDADDLAYESGGKPLTECKVRENDPEE